jgi:hypothetical protein
MHHREDEAFYIQEGELEFQHPVWGRFQSDQDQCFAACIDKVPRRVVDGDVDVTDAGRYCEGTFAEHRQYAQVLRSILDEDAALGQRFGKRRIND